MADGAAIELRLIGEPRLRRGGEEQAFPPSKKTRALLAYLVTTGRRQRRDHLCAILWELPSDPRAALRWSLSKIKGLLGPGGERYLVTDRDGIALDTSEWDVDLTRLERAFDAGFDGTSTETLLAMSDSLLEPFLLGLDLHNDHDFHAWCLAERQRVCDMQVALSSELLGRAGLTRAQQLTLLRKRVELAPDIHAFRTALANGMEAAPTAETLPLVRAAAPTESQPLSQEVRFCKASDGTRIAYATTGNGPLIVKAANWLNHLEYDWESPIWKHLVGFLTTNHTLVRYDERCTGLSDWEPAEMTPEACVADLEAVVEAAGADSFTLLGVSQGAAFSVAYAARHPERVSKLIIIGGYATGWNHRDISDRERVELDAFNSMVLHGWGKDTPAYRQMFTSMYIPSATREQMDWFNEMQRKSASAQNAMRVRAAAFSIDFADLLGKVKAPTLVLHAEGDVAVPFKWGREIAAGIPHARFVALPSNNHLILEQEPAWPLMRDEIQRFLEENPD